VGFKDGDMIEHSMISKSIERAQKKVEENNFGIRKRLLEYDDVMNKQRTVIYTKRRHALIGERIGMDIVNMVWDRCCHIVENYTFEDAKMEMLRLLAIELPIATEEEFKKNNPEKNAEKCFEAAMASFKQRTERMAEIALPFIDFVYKEHPEMHDNHIYVPITDGRHVYQIPVNLKAAYETRGKEVIKSFEKAILLHTIDNAWKENLRDLDDLKHSVQNASYEQKDPLLIFKLESVTLFDKMVNKINDQTVSILMRGQIPVQEREKNNVKVAPDPNRNRQQQRYNETKVDLNDPNQQAAAQRDTRENVKREPVRVEKTVGRNDPCPCGSGKKFKNCHGKNL
jgi:preprotein translocase subunit SecA